MQDHDLTRLYLGTYQLAAPVFHTKRTIVLNPQKKEILGHLDQAGLKIVFGRNGGINRLTYDEDCSCFGNFTLFFNGNNNHATIAGKTLDNANLFGRADFVGNNSACVITERSIQESKLKIHLWGNHCFFYWGPNSYSNGTRFDIQGNSKHIIVRGKSAFSDGTWAANSDMHPIHDLATGNILNRQVDMIFEDHILVGRDAGILCAERIGHDSVIGAKSLVKKSVGACSCWAGIPARKIRDNITWGSFNESPASLLTEHPLLK
jgi:acetyltransferase-like isoleucine patch superfamily enzyme